MKILLELTEYHGGFWLIKRKGLGQPALKTLIGEIGNAGIAADFAEMLKKLGHNVIIRETTPERVEVKSL